MVKFLKFVLIIVVIIFAFALGVKFSDYFKGNLKNDELKVQQEMDKAFRDVENRTEKMEAPKVQDNLEPIANEGQQGVEELMPEFVDIEVVEPMDNIQTNQNDPMMEENQEKQNVNNQIAPTTNEKNVEQMNKQPQQVVPVQQPQQVPQQMPQQPAPVQQPVKAPVKK